MRVAYLVLSHRERGQVLRLVAALKEGPGAEVLVRHDPRGPPLERAELERLGARAIPDDFEFEWGRWSQLQILLSGLRAAARLDPDWVLVLSGQDYPLRPLTEVESRLAATGADALLGSVREVPTKRRPEPPDEEFYLRCAYRHYGVPARLPHLPRRVRGAVYLRELPPPGGRLIGVRRLRLPYGPHLRPYVSADWLTLSRRALRFVLDSSEPRSPLMRHHRRSLVPSESFFATLLLNEPSLEVGRDNRRYARFPRPDAPHPDTLTSSDLGQALASGADFARKFDVCLDARALDLLDERRHRESGARLRH